jgi:adenosylcobyric acid synthase
VIIPGSKNVLDDLIFLHESGLAQRIRILAKEGRVIVGICGGYQMLGKVVYDNLGIESNQQQVEGLGLLPVETEITPVKVTAQVVAEVVARQGFLTTLQGQKVTGYEIHMGKSIIQGRVTPVFKISERNQTSVEVEDGAINRTGNVIGTYLHGLFENTNLRQAFISYLASLESKPVSKEINDYHFFREEQFNLLAEVLKKNLKMDFIYQLVKGEKDFAVADTPCFFD